MSYRSGLLRICNVIACRESNSIKKKISHSHKILCDKSSNIVPNALQTEILRRNHLWFNWILAISNIRHKFEWRGKRVCELSFSDVCTECIVVLRCSTEWRRFDSILCTSIWMCVKVNSILYGGKVILLIIYYVCAPICGLFCSFSAPKRCNIVSSAFLHFFRSECLFTRCLVLCIISIFFLLLVALINQTCMLVNIILVLFSQNRLTLFVA